MPARREVREHGGDVTEDRSRRVESHLDGERPLGELADELRLFDQIDGDAT